MVVLFLLRFPDSRVGVVERVGMRSQYTYVLIEVVLVVVKVLLQQFLALAVVLLGVESGMAGGIGLLGVWVMYLVVQVVTQYR